MPTSPEYSAILIFESFDQIGTLPDHHPIEAVIRSAFQISLNTSHIFIGSSNKWMNEIFLDRERPFYCSTDAIRLPKISTRAYASFIKEAFTERWDTTVAPETIAEILSNTLRHPFYVNQLCSRLWNDKSPPSVERVEQFWTELELEFGLVDYSYR